MTFDKEFEAVSQGCPWICKGNYEDAIFQLLLFSMLCILKTGQSNKRGKGYHLPGTYRVEIVNENASLIEWIVWYYLVSGQLDDVVKIIKMAHVS